MHQDIFLRNGFVAIPGAAGEPAAGIRALATVVANLASYGYTIDRAAHERLTRLGTEALTGWWLEAEPLLAAITGVDRDMESAVVYRNFPREVLDMDLAGYVVRQVGIYLGIPYDELREVPEERQPLGDPARLKVLSLADASTAARILAGLEAQTTRWNDDQRGWAAELFATGNGIVVDAFGFRENGIRLAAARFADAEVAISTGTDALRLAAGLSGADISLRERPRFRPFRREERRRLLHMLENATDLSGDVARRPEPFKRLFERLRPGDYATRFPRTVAVRDRLHNGALVSFAARIDPQKPDIRILDAAAERPGEFLRRFHRLYALLGEEAVRRLLPLMDKLGTKQLVAFARYVASANARSHLMHPPRGDWSKVQVRPNRKAKIAERDVLAIAERVAAIVRERLAADFPEGLSVDPEIERVKLQTNDQKLASYGRGTRIPFPADATFARTASYWRKANSGDVWYDNGWNFFSADWRPLGAACWNVPRFEAGKEVAALFSGDPAIGGDPAGRGCQMIDLYPEALRRAGVRYAVWSVLCYSRLPFAKADEVLATLSFGAEPQKGSLYDPAQAEMAFPLRSNALSSFVAYLDLAEHDLVYMDAALPAVLSTAAANTSRLAELMPAYLEYLDALPSLWDVASLATPGTTPILFDDDVASVRAERAYVFRPRNEASSYERLAVTDFVA